MKRAYFRTWNQHNPPREPVDEVDYTASEPWDAICLASFEGSRLRRFEKFLFERTPVHAVTLAVPRAPGSWLYVRPDAQGAVSYEEALVVPYEATQNLMRFGRATVGADGLHADLYHVERKLLFTDSYAYRPDGSIESVTVTWSDGRVETHRPTSHEPPMSLP
jgi:hypothetical protein